MRIFDLGTGEDQTPLQRAAARLAEQKEERRDLSLARVRNLITYESTIVAESETAALKMAQTRALKSAASRVYFDNYMLLGRDLLEPYLAQNGDPFVARTTVVERRILHPDQVEITSRVSVNLDSLYEDLAEKKFIAKPNARPILAVHLQEIVDGERSTAHNARERFERDMGGNVFRVFSDQVTAVPLDQDLSNSPNLLRQARLDAQRHNVDILVTGTISIRPGEQDQILFDDYEFQEAEVLFHVYRVDTGEELTTINKRYSAKGYDREDAINNVLDSTMQQAAKDLTVHLRNLWPNLMLESTENVRMMISNLEEDEIASVYNFIQAIEPGVKIYEKSYYGDVAVINLVMPGDSLELVEDLERSLRESAEPQFSVRRIDERRIEVDAL